MVQRLIILIFLFLVVCVFPKPVSQKCTETTCSNQGKCVEKSKEVKCLCSKGFTGQYCELTVREFSNGAIRRMEITGFYNRSSESQPDSETDSVNRALNVFDLMFDLLKQQFKRYFVEKLANKTESSVTNLDLLDKYRLSNSNVAIIRQLSQNDNE